MKNRKHGEGTVYKDNTKGLWRGTIIIGLDPNTGKPIRKCVQGKTKKEVEAKMDALTSVLRKGTDLGSEITVVDLIKERNDDAKGNNDIRESTANRRDYVLKAIEKFTFSRKPIRKVDAADIRTFFYKLPDIYSESVIKKIYHDICYAFSEAYRRKIIDKNPITDGNIKCPKSRKTKRAVEALSEAEETRLVKALNEEIYCFNYSPRNRYNSYSVQSMLMLFTGMRAGEVNALSFDDVDLENRIIHIRHTIATGFDEKLYLSKPKTKAGSRDIIIDSNTVALLKYYINNIYPILKKGKNQKSPDGKSVKMLFFSKKGELIRTVAFNDWLKRFAKRHDILDDSESRLSTHRLRHTYATRCVNGKVPPQILKELMGHSNIKITLETYYHTSVSEIEKAVSAGEEYLKQLGISFENNNKGGDDMN